MRGNLDLPTRRTLLLLGPGALFAWAYAPKLARAEGRDPRFLAIILRGALDGLAMVAPVGDPDWVKLRGDKALTLAGTTPALPLDGFFALNPAMPNLHRLYQAGEAIFVHAAATPYRERSHFDGQDVLESGLDRPGRTESGWLNRTVASLEPDRGVRLHNNNNVFAVGPTTPLVVRGSAPVMLWTPPRLAPAPVDTVTRVLDLYRHTDLTLARVLDERIGLAAIAQENGMDPKSPGNGAQQQPIREMVRAYFAETAGAAATYLANPDGPRLGALAFNGWDTHINEGAAQGTLAFLLAALDDAIAAIRSKMGNAWSETVVALTTEFGRTAHINGSEGTDHGTGTVVILAGGALKGGRVIADWPGVKESDLFENRDLKPTIDLRAVLKGVLKEHLRVDDAALAGTIFPGSEAAAPLDGLV